MSLAPKQMPKKLSAPDWCFFRPGMDAADYYRGLADAGFGAVEMVAPERFDAARAAGLEIIDLAGPGMMQGLNRPEHHEKLVPQIREVMQQAAEAEIPAVVVFSGNRDGQPDAEGLGHVAEGLSALLGDAEQLGVELWFEMLCQRNHPDYQADRSAYGFELHERVASPRLRILYDVYHMKQMGEDVYSDVLEHLDAIAHIHLADVPERSCPRSDERIAFRKLIERARAAGYTGYFGVEFIPKEAGVVEAAAAARHLVGVL
jgi:hydroxypyruvate isomerase